MLAGCGHSGYCEALAIATNSFAAPGFLFGLSLMAELLDSAVLQELRVLIEFIGSECVAVPMGWVG
jgi:hypothetical protein